MIPTDIQTERRNATVLVIDDEEDVRLATVDYLSSVYQFVVDGVDSGETALSLLEKKQYDAIISDYKMKGMSGIDLLKAIRSRGDDTPFLIFTGRGREEVVIAAFENGADGYVMKGGEVRSQFADLAQKVISLVEQRDIEKRLWEIQERFKEIYVNSPIAIELYDKTGTLIDVNPACCELFGIHSSDEVRGFHLFDDPNIPTESLLLLKKGESIRYQSLFDFELVRKQNLYATTKKGKIHVDVQITPMYEGEHQISGYLVHVIDITDKILAEEHLKSQKRLLDQVLHTIPSPVFAKDRNGRYTICNAAFEQYIGMKKDEIVGKTVFEIAPHNLALIYYQKDKELFDRPGTQLYESQVRYADGSLHDVIFEKATLINENGDAEGLTGVILDITERKRVEDELRNTNRLLEGILDGIPDIIGIQKPNHQVIRYNKAGYEILGLTPEQVVGKPCYTFIGRTTPCEICATSRALISKKREMIEKYVPELKRHIICRSNPILDEHGDIQLIVEQVTDITERKQMEDAIKQSNQKLRLLVGLTRHDILNMLNAIHYFHELALTTPDPGTCQQFITHAQEAGKRIEALIGFTREYEEFGEAGAGWQSIHAIVHAAQKEISTGSIRIENLIPTDCDIYADPIIRKVFSTLIENAVRHGKKLTYIRFSTIQKNKELYIICEDDGVGVPVEKKNQIFGRGYGDHTGIGLFLAREILSITNLTIQETGTEGSGARFEILVPEGRYRCNHQ